ncbi:MAG: hypothetical protein IE910_01185 [Brevundimonas sp.]|nr:hypothetical protein [Brevundimonas sp.]
MTPSPSQPDEEDRKRRALVLTIRRLPRRYRDVFVLHRFTGMSLEQITEHLGIEKRAVETRLAQALIWLSRAVDGEGRRAPPER